MKRNNLMKILMCQLVLASLITPVFGQKQEKPIIFAVINDGNSLEPIAFIEKGKLTAPVGGDSDEKLIESFNKTYYKPKTVYRLIFGGVNAGTVTVVSSNAKSDCAKNMAGVGTQSTKTKLGGFIMALATASVAKKAASGLRRKPTTAEKTEIDSLVRTEFANQKVAASAIKNLHYQNLTALDVDNDKKVEFVGSYWVETSATERALLFFIAEKNAKGKYEFGFSNFHNVKKDEVMSTNLKDIDTGIYHELLLDAFDYDDDGVSEIFTYTQSFEGAGFTAYKRESGKWEKVFEGSNYHCGY
ncbi:MAG: hypothetical protein ABJA66_16330 [Actinomycetota bacterium]